MWSSFSLLGWRRAPQPTANFEGVFPAHRLFSAASMLSGLVCPDGEGRGPTETPESDLVHPEGRGGVLQRSRVWSSPSWGERRGPTETPKSGLVQPLGTSPVRVVMKPLLAPSGWVVCPSGQRTGESLVGSVWDSRGWMWGWVRSQFCNIESPVQRSSKDTTAKILNNELKHRLQNKFLVKYEKEDVCGW